MWGSISNNGSPAIKQKPCTTVHMYFTLLVFKHTMHVHCARAMRHTRINNTPHSNIVANTTLECQYHALYMYLQLLSIPFFFDNDSKSGCSSGIFEWVVHWLWTLDTTLGNIKGNVCHRSKGTGQKPQQQTCGN